MIYSLSEIDATSKKAARGAGLSWGYAEEAGKAARWLAAHQLPGAALLATYLTQRQKNAKHYEGSNPKCPLLAGASLCDAGFDEIVKSNDLEHVVYPLLLLPYLAQITQASGVGLQVQWSGTQISCSDGIIHIKEDTSIATGDAHSVQCYALDAASMDESCVRQKTAVGQHIDEAHWSQLESLAHFTYVPATEESRRGAGPSG